MKRSGLWFKISKFIPLVVLLTGMQIAVDTGAISSLYLASPTQFVTELWNLFADGTVYEHLWTTLEEFAAGFTASVLLGVGIGVLVATHPRLEEFLAPYFSALMAIPKVTLVPLLTIWFGITLLSKGILIFLFGFFSVFYNTVSGIKQVSSSHLKVARVFEANPFQVTWKVLLPSAMPTIFAGVRVAAATGFVGAIFSEMLASKNGLGNLLTKASQIYDTALLFALIVLVTLLSVLVIQVIDFIEKHVVLRWKYKS